MVSFMVIMGKFISVCVWGGGGGGGGEGSMLYSS